MATWRRAGARHATAVVTTAASAQETATQRERVRAPRGSAASAVVWAIWGAMVAAALAAIALYGRDMPLAEDWTMVPALTGHEPDLASWLWSQNNEHRVPLPRLLYLALLEASGGDFRVGMIANALILAALAGAMIVTARRVRGRSSLADAFFPLALLHLGHWINVVWGWQLQFVTSVALMLVLLIVVVRQEAPLAWPGTLAVAAAYVLLPLTGASGLIVVAVMTPWVALAAWPHLRSRGDGSRAIGLTLVGAIVVAGAIGVLYFVGYVRPWWNPPSPSHLATFSTAAMVLAFGWGPVAERAWIPAIVAAGLVLGSYALLTLRAIVRERGVERVRAIGLGTFGLSMLILAVGIGYGRAAQLPTVGLPHRYVLFAVPAFCAAFFTWERYGPAFALRAVPAVLAIIYAALLWPNARAGFFTRDWYLAGVAAVERDIAAGTDAKTIGRRHRSFLMHWDEPGLIARIEMLRDAGIGPFARVPDREP